MSPSTILCFFVGWLRQLSNKQQHLYRSNISPSLKATIQLINDLSCVCDMPNLDTWINQNEDMTTNTINIFEIIHYLLKMNAKQ